MTHRPSFEVGNNDFISLRPDGTFYSTVIEGEPYCIPGNLIAKFNEHAATGAHPDCVICQCQDERETGTGFTIRGGEVVEVGGAAISQEEIF